MTELRKPNFIEDQSGGGTVMGLFSLILIVGIFGLAVDTTGGLHTKTDLQAADLQATADAAAPAASIGLADEGMADGGAPLLTELNMSTAEFGAALRAGDVEFGTWNPETKTFIVEVTGAEAVRLQTPRSTSDGMMNEHSSSRSAAFTGSARA